METLKLRPYQERMAEFGLRTPRQMKGMDLGLGKTVTALTLIQASLFDRFDSERWLVVAPKLVAEDGWPAQLTRWKQFEHLKWRLLTAEDLKLTPGVTVRVLDPETGELVEEEMLMSEVPPGTDPKNVKRGGLTFVDRRATKARLLSYREPIHIVSWDLLAHVVKALGRNPPYDGLVLDESTFAQNISSTRHRACWHMAHRIRPSCRVTELTGLMAPNGRMSVHGQVRLLDGGQRLGKTKGEFIERWMVPDKKDWKSGRVFSFKPAPGAVERMDTALADIVATLKSEDYLDLPPCVINDVYVSLPPGARKLYDELHAKLVAEIEASGEEVVAASQGVLASKLMQVAGGAVYLDDGVRFETVHDAKVERLRELLEAATGPVLLVYNYDHEWQRIKKTFKHAVNITETGALKKFKEGKIALLCGHPASFGHGTDGLQDVCNEGIWFGATSNFEQWEQVRKRLHRSGQKQKGVIFTRILAADTREVQVAEEVIPRREAESDALNRALSLRGLSHA